ncbi:MAG: sensor histidine kinase [Otoolea sp.]
MIYRLRKKFILISAASILIVFTAIFSVMCLVSFRQVNRTMDLLTDAIASNDGEFPEFEAAVRLLPSGGLSSYVDVITEETKFSTRFFTVWLDKEEKIDRVNVDSVFSISEAQAQEYAAEAVEKGKERGWLSVYRYKMVHAEKETEVVFVNGAMHRTMAGRFLLNSFLVLFGSGVIILGLFILLSKRAVKPVAVGYEKQKQFITDANHELKTPLTLILSNLEIVEEEIGKNEWLDDIRIEGERMGMLVNQLVTLSRMDEEQSVLAMERFDLSNAVEDTVSEFQPLAEERDKTLTAEIEPSIIYRGEENLIRRLVSILLDNAVKYCDPGGQITLSVSKRRHPVLVVENTYRDVDQIALEKLFDRFYRADKARTFDGGFGVGLSIARGIARQHHGDISVYKKNGMIGFRVDLR